MKTMDFQGQRLFLRASAEAEIPALRLLVNSAYKELADMGLNYTATYQNEDTTRDRVAKGKAFVLELNDQIVATILYSKENHFTNKNTAYVGQFAVLHDCKNK